MHRYSFYSNQGFVKFKNPRELVEKFLGKILIQQSYRTDPELDFYVGDMVAVTSLTYALGEIESRESDFTREGLEFFKYALEHSDMDHLLTRYFYRPDYIQSSLDLLKHEPLDCRQRDSNRIFHAFIESKNSRLVAQHLGIDLDVLYPPNLREYDNAFKQSFCIFEELFRQANFFVAHEFNAYKSHKKEYLIYVKIFKKVSQMVFSPLIYIQDIRDNKGNLLNNGRETIKILLEKGAINLNPYRKDFQNGVKKLFLKTRNIAENIDNHSFEDIKTYLERTGLVQYRLRAGKLWDDQSKMQRDIDRANLD